MSNIKQEINKIVIPSTLQERSKMGVQKAHLEKGRRVKRFIRRNMVSAILAATLIIPTSAIAYQTNLADEIYGTFENVRTHISSATMEGYLLLDAKLSQAKGDMEKEEYKHFKELLNVITDAKLAYGNKYGNIDYTQVPNEHLDELKKTLFEIQPYFDKLNGQKSSIELLTSKEYEEYIEAIIIYEQIMAKSNIKDSDELDKIPSELREEFLKAENILLKVNEKQLGQ